MIRIARMAGLLALAVGLTTLIGWMLGMPGLRSGFGIGTDMNPITAIMIGMSGLALVASTLATDRGKMLQVPTIAAAVIVVVSALRLGEAAFGWHVPLDLLFADALRTAEPGIAKMTTGSAFSALLMGLALLGLRFAGDRWVPLARAAVAVGSLLPALVVIAFIVRMLSGDGGAASGGSLPLNAALGWVLVATGIFALSGRKSSALDDSIVIGRRMNLIVGVAIVILIVTSSVSIYSGLNSRKSVRAGDQHLSRRAELAMLLNAVQEAESGQRGFILTQQDDFVAPYHTGADSVRPRLERIRLSVDSSNVSQRDRLVELERLIDQKLTLLASTVALQREGRHSDAVASVTAGVGDSLMTQIRRTVNAMTAHEDSVLATIAAQRRQVDTTSVLTNLIAGCLAVAFLAFAGHAVTADMRKRAIAETAVRTSEKQLAQVIDLVPVALFLKDPVDLRLTSVNKAALDLMGFSESEMTGRSLSQLFPEDESGVWAEQDREALAGSSVLVIPEETVHTRHRGERILHTRKVAVRDDTERPTFLLCVSEDITERKQNEIAVRDAKDAAEKANRAKSDFLAKMSHELRTPLNSIIGFSELLEDESAGPLNPKQKRFVSNVIVSGRNLLELINDILDLSRIESGRMELSIEEVELPRVAEQVRSIVMALADQKRLTVHVNIDRAMPRIAADSARLKQILFNLLGNAIKFTPEGGTVGLSATLLQASSPDAAPMVEIAVRDTGIGIAAEDQERIFAEFVQVGDSAGMQKGTGLGLAITRMLVEMHGGRISVESEPGVGSTFRFTVPMHCDARSAVVPATRTSTAAQSVSGPRVLVVENDEHARDLITHYLEDEGYRVVAAATADEAIRLAREIQPDAITLDIVLPDRDGLSVLAHLKQDDDTRGIPVVVVSITDRREIGFSLGASDWLVKPVDRSALLAAIRATTGDHGANGTRTILVVDDEEQARDYVKDLLVPLGYDVVTAAGGREGLALVETAQPDLMILDLMMPDMNGFEVVEALRATPAVNPVPILILTSKELSNSDRKALRRTVDGVVHKGGREELLAQLSVICSAPVSS